MSDLGQDWPPGAFDKDDPSDDACFYRRARFVTHVDEAALAALTRFYGVTLPPGGVVLDLMSSHVSHLPALPELSEVIGHGMNAQELAANPRLTRWFVQDLNHSPALPLPDRSCDASLCCVGVQYLQRPVEVFAEVARVLRPGAPFIVSFSNRCFPTKAVRLWTGTGAGGHTAVVRAYFERAGFSDVAARVLADGARGDLLVAVMGRATS